MRLGVWGGALAAMLMAGTGTLADGGTRVKWASVPVGCKIVRVKSDGSTEVDEFLGLQDSHYVVVTHAGRADGPELLTTFYNEQGYEDGRALADGRGGRFVPYSCIAELGDCAFTYIDQDGFRFDYKGHSVPIAGGLVAKGGLVGFAPFADATYFLGPHNIVTFYRDEVFSYRVTHLIGCGVMGWAACGRLTQATQAHRWPVARMAG